MDGYNHIRKEWTHRKHEESSMSEEYEQLLEKCSDKFDQAKEIIEILTMQNEEKSEKI